MSVDDPGAIQVVGRELDPDTIAGQDPDAEPPHLARHVTEHDAIHVVQLHAKHRVGQGLDDLTFEFDFFFFGQC